MTRLLLVLGLLLGQPVVSPATPIDHFVVLMQSNHSFDNYFGTYPGADGIPADVCMPHNSDAPSSDRCVKPFRLGAQSPSDLDHLPSTQRAQYNQGKMDGFVEAYRKRGRDGTNAMGYYDRAELPFYWNFADRFTLFDRFFSSARGGNLFYWVTGQGPSGDVPTIFDRLQDKGVSWRFYVENYAKGEKARVPLLSFPRFSENPELASHIVDLSEYYRDLSTGTLPSVAYVVSSGSSENPPSRIQAGQELVRSMTSSLARSRYWSSSAFMVTWDGPGGFYDHVSPPQVDRDGYGFRVPALLMSAYARRGHVDHTEADHTAVLRFIEDNWGLAPLGPRDARSPNLFSAFDFSAPARPPELVGTLESAAPAASKSGVVYVSYGLAVVIAAGCLVARRARRLRPVVAHGIAGLVAAGRGAAQRVWRAKPNVAGMVAAGQGLGLRVRRAKPADPSGPDGTTVLGVASRRATQQIRRAKSAASHHLAALIASARDTTQRIRRRWKP
ncbi:alkaline phosphatase family protein [Lentzea aerocolonigenes]|uniref:alkaline phosphatase family protein n=1 Tax=Lentzea aerocolonigenes TaxID=68170 RepID=UPI0004C3557C|nr:alkaline phosphatase family protein [Lentzea aerocolonigenes]MCP2241934.1 phospholipase C [Lentzea aerocolonigenes]